MLHNDLWVVDMMGTDAQKEFKRESEEEEEFDGSIIDEEDYWDRVGEFGTEERMKEHMEEEKEADPGVKFRWAHYQKVHEM